MTKRRKVVSEPPSDVDEDESPSNGQKKESPKVDSPMQTAAVAKAVAATSPMPPPDGREMATQTD
jgi:hypothetical protein